MKSMTDRGTARRSRLQKGATMVEFALVMPVAILLVLGIIQMGLMYSAKEMLNEATFQGARAGSLHHADVDSIKKAMARAMVPFYQDNTTSDDLERVAVATIKALADFQCDDPTKPCSLKIEILNPTPEVFADFGVTSNQSQGHTYIPNDNLEIRPHDVKGPTSGVSIQDANTLKIRVTYGYPLAVPLMRQMFGAIMCGAKSGIDAFGVQSLTPATSDDCRDFYSQGRVPLVAYATVQMQTPAWKPD
ncbi:MAG TPA: TadE family protein [Steroidobacteraceae bacterium]|nr:TadE family protein [Steroidobacteraceae bacterium]